jgi:ABC-type transport system involved in multi-copper enzyme maturation permease subunit
MRILWVELDRCLHRRLTWILAFAAVAGCLLTLILTLVNVKAADPINLVDLWPPRDQGDPLLLVPITIGILGALVFGSSMVGAEWKAGTIPTLLTWESRRVRVAASKIAAPAIVAAVLSLVLEALFVASLLPVIVSKGSTAGTDSKFWRALTGGTLRGFAVIAMAGAIGAVIALVARTTSAATGIAFLYLNLGEGFLRGFVKSSRSWLLTDNAVVFLTGHRIEQGRVGHSTLAAGLTLAAYTVALGALATWVFKRRDL